MRKKTEMVEYSRVDDGAPVSPEEAQEIFVEKYTGACFVVRHRVSTRIEYLVEYPNGTRAWVSQR